MIVKTHEVFSIFVGKFNKHPDFHFSREGLSPRAFLQLDSLPYWILSPPGSSI